MNSIFDANSSFATGTRPDKNYGVSIFVRRNISLHRRVQTCFEEDPTLCLMGAKLLLRNVKWAARKPEPSASTEYECHWSHPHIPALRNDVDHNYDEGKL